MAAISELIDIIKGICVTTRNIVRTNDRESSAQESKERLKEGWALNLGVFGMVIDQATQKAKLENGKVVIFLDH